MACCCSMRSMSAGGRCSGRSSARSDMAARRTRSWASTSTRSCSLRRSRSIHHRRRGILSYLELRHVFPQNRFFHIISKFVFAVKQVLARLGGKSCPYAVALDFLMFAPWFLLIINFNINLHFSHQPGVLERRSFFVNMLSRVNRSITINRSWLV